MKLPELLAPAGTLRKMQVAYEYGADAVYAGAAGFSMRPDGAALDLDDLARAVEMKNKFGRKLYIALNVMTFNDELDSLAQWLEAVRDLGIDGFIVGDAGVFALAKEICPDVELHISTQMGVANWRAAKFWRDCGASRVVLARECELAMAGEIAEKADVEVETFVHGAMCVAVSGRCLLSAYMTGHSGSRGKCKHACRWNYRLVEEQRPNEYIPVVETGRETILLGSKDLCLIEHIPEIVRSGVCSLKIEGRMKSEYYVATVVRAYRAALDAYAANPENYCFDLSLINELHAVSHRAFSTGFAFGYPGNTPEDLQTENGYVMTHEFCGYTLENGNVFIKNPFRPGEVLEWIAPAGLSGSITVNEVGSVTGKIWEVARPENECVVKYEGGRMPTCAMLRRRISE